MSLSGKSNSPVERVITNNGFFPDLNVKEFQEQYRVNNSFALETIVTELVLAISIINRQLNSWQMVQTGTLDNIAPEQIDGQGVLTIFYKAAVYTYARASLQPLFATLGGRKEAVDWAEDTLDLEKNFFTQSSDYVGRISSYGKPLTKSRMNSGLLTCGN